MNTPRDLFFTRVDDGRSLFAQLQGRLKPKSLVRL